MVMPHGYLTQKRAGNTRKSVNVVDLIDTVKLERKKEKKKTIIMVAATVSALAVFGLIIAV